jgi:hypothetical protein
MSGATVCFSVVGATRCRLDFAAIFSPSSVMTVCVIILLQTGCK